MQQRLANEDEEYPQGFNDGPLYDEEPDEGDYWFDEEEDCYDFPEDNEDGLFDPMEAEKP
jgi:hypothetical protein